MLKRISLMYERYILHNPIRVLLFLALILSFSIVNIKYFELDASADTLILDDDEDLKIFRDTNAKYKSSDFMIVTITDKYQDTFSPETLSFIKILTQEITKADYVESVTSITNIPLVTSSQKPLTELINEVPNIFSEDINKRLAREEILSSPIYKDLIISSDAKTSAMQIVIRKNQNLLDALNKRNMLYQKYVSNLEYEDEYIKSKAA